VNTKLVYLWFGLATVAFTGTVFAFMNFWAAVDLGYDASSNGRIILSRWTYTLIGLGLSTLLFSGLAIRAWVMRRRSINSKSEHENAA
jgi:hypothetical protein